MSTNLNTRSLSFLATFNQIENWAKNQSPLTDNCTLFDLSIEEENQAFLAFHKKYVNLIRNLSKKNRHDRGAILTRGVRGLKAEDWLKYSNSLPQFR